MIFFNAIDLIRRCGLADVHRRSRSRLGRYGAYDRVGDHLGESDAASARGGRAASRGERRAAKVGADADESFRDDCAVSAIENFAKQVSDKKLRDGQWARALRLVRDIHHRS